MQIHKTSEFEKKSPFFLLIDSFFSKQKKSHFCTWVAVDINTNRRTFDINANSPKGSGVNDDVWRLPLKDISFTRSTRAPSPSSYSGYSVNDIYIFLIKGPCENSMIVSEREPNVGFIQALTSSIKQHSNFSAFSINSFASLSSERVGIFISVGKQSSFTDSIGAGATMSEFSQKIEILKILNYLSSPQITPLFFRILEMIFFKNIMVLPCINSYAVSKVKHKGKNLRALSIVNLEASNQETKLDFYFLIRSDIKMKW